MTISDKTLRLLRQVESKNVRDIVGETFYSDPMGYSNNAHNTNYQDLDGYRAFCKQIYTDFYNKCVELQKENKTKGNLNIPALLSNPSLSPKELDKSPNRNIFADTLEKFDGIFKNTDAEIFHFQNKTPFIWKENEANDDNFLHIYGFNLNSQEFHSKDVNARLYLNLKAKNIPTFALKAYNLCKKENLPFYFKFSLHDNRNDPFLFYSTYENLPDFYRIIKQIEQESPELFEGCEKTSQLVGKLDDVIGYGDEPSEVGKESFTSVRRSAYNAIRTSLTDKAKTVLPSEPKKCFRYLGAKYYISDDFYASISDILRYKVTEFVSKYVNLSTLTPYQKQQLFTMTKNRAETQFENWLINGYKSKDFETFTLSDKDKSVQINIPFSKFNFLNKFTSKSGASLKTDKTRELSARALIIRSSYFSDVLTQKENLLLKTTHENMVKSLKEDLKGNPSNTSAIEHLKALDKPYENLDSEGLSLLYTGAYAFSKKGTVFVNNGYSANGFVLGASQTMDMYDDLFGKDATQKIINEKCEERKISPTNTSFNKETDDTIEKYEHDHIFEI